MAVAPSTPRTADDTRKALYWVVDQIAACDGERNVVWLNVPALVVRMPVVTAHQFADLRRMTAYAAIKELRRYGFACTIVACMNGVTGVRRVEH